MRSRLGLVFILAAGCASPARPRLAPDASAGSPVDAPVAVVVPVDASSAPGGETVTPDAAAPLDAAIPVPVDAAAAAGCQHILCEDFEGYQDGDLPDPTRWAQQATKATVSSMLAARGSHKALHIPPFTKDKVQLRETATFPALEKAFYARVFLYVDKQPTETPDRLYHWTLIEASEASDDSGHRVRLGGHIEKSVGPTDWLRFNYETGTADGETGLSDPSSVIEVKKWHCIEVYFDMATSEARVWLDDVERTKLHWKNNMPGAFTFPAAIKSLSFGWVEYQPPRTPWDVWLDEVAVDSKKIGCAD
jgi:hypothetical protein